jgi:hypothetical protein
LKQFFPSTFPITSGRSNQLSYLAIISVLYEAAFPADLPDKIGTL